MAVVGRPGAGGAAEDPFGSSGQLASRPIATHASGMLPP